MKGNFPKCLDFVLHHEGGFVDHPKDPGGVTNLGCTKDTWEKWCGHPVTVNDMKNLQPHDVMPLYRQKYWDAVKGDELPTGVDYCVFDTAINSGPGRAVKFLQEAIGVTADGAIGPITMKAINSANPQELIEGYCAARLKFLRELSTWETFGRGWERRVNEVKKSALSMI